MFVVIIILFSSLLSYDVYAQTYPPGVDVGDWCPNGLEGGAGDAPTPTGVYSVYNPTICLQYCQTVHGTGLMDLATDYQTDDCCCEKSQKDKDEEAAMTRLNNGLQLIPKDCSFLGYIVDNPSKCKPSEGKASMAGGKICCTLLLPPIVTPPPSPSPSSFSGSGGSSSGGSSAAQIYTNPIGGSAGSPVGMTDFKKIIGIILKGILGLLGTIALLAFVYGGALWLFSRGDPKEVQKGLDTMLYAGIGIIIVLGSYAILQRIFEIIPH